MLQYIHLHPVNVVGYLAAFIGGVVSVATNPATPGVLGGLGTVFPHSHAISVIAALVTCVASIATAIRPAGNQPKP